MTCAAVGASRTCSTIHPPSPTPSSLTRSSLIVSSRRPRSSASRGPREHAPVAPSCPRKHGIRIRLTVGINAPARCSIDSGAAPQSWTSTTASSSPSPEISHTGRSNPSLVRSSHRSHDRPASAGSRGLPAATAAPATPAGGCFALRSSTHTPPAIHIAAATANKPIRPMAGNDDSPPARSTLPRS